MKKIKYLKQVAALILSAAVCGCSAVKSEYNDGFFAFDTFVNIRGYGMSGENGQLLREKFEILDKSFQSAYGADANTLMDESLSECAVSAAEFSQKYGDTVNLTIGAVTELWGISTEAPLLPEKNLLDEALFKVRDTDYYNGDFSKYEEGVRLDFGAAAKGYACDKAYAFLEQTDTSGAVISMGSSTLLYGSKPDGSMFKAAVKNPVKPEEYLGIISTEPAFISTSGGYERYFELDGVRYEHILSAETGYPVETDLVSVTVIVPADTKGGGQLSDMLSTTVYAEGTAGLENYLSDTGFFIVAADKNMNVYTSAGVDFELYENSGFTNKN